MPNSITHPFHKPHPLTLLPQPAYAGGEFRCDACGDNGAAFSYHCAPCGVDLHIHCAAAPLTLATPRHDHKLHLFFASPYETGNFDCDVCRGRGGDHWLYRCAGCGFDAHLKCALAPAPAVAGVPVVNYGGNELAIQAAIAQMVRNNNAMAQAMLAAGGGSGGGGFGIGGDRGVQQMMQVMTALNRGGVDVFGGGGDSLQSLLGGGGLDFLGGGGGGLDFLGGGGLDFLGGLL